MASPDTMLYIKEDLIIPNGLTFYELIVNRARGKSGPLFHFDVHEASPRNPEFTENPETILKIRKISEFGVRSWDAARRSGIKRNLILCPDVPTRNVVVKGVRWSMVRKLWMGDRMIAVVLCVLGKNAALSAPPCCDLKLRPPSPCRLPHRTFEW
jgi:hypothetical protein